MRRKNMANNSGGLTFDGDTEVKLGQGPLGEKLLLFVKYSR